MRGNHRKGRPKKERRQEAKFISGKGAKKGENASNKETKYVSMSGMEGLAFLAV